MNEWENLLQLMKSLGKDVDRFQVVFNNRGKICGVVWVLKEKKEPVLKLYKAGADATRF